MLMPSLKTISTSACLNGGATLFFTTLILMRLPVISLPCFRTSLRRMSSLTLE